MHDFLLLQDGIWKYVAVFFALLGGAFGLPIPEDLPLIVSGVMIHQGSVKLSGIVIVCYVAVLLGDVVIFRIGKKLGPALFTRRWFRRRVSLSQIKKMRANLEKRSFLMIVIARHLFYFRTVTFLICGAVKMSFWKFMLADMLAAMVSLPIMLTLGYLGSEHFDLIVEWFESARKWFILVSVILIGAGAYWYFKIRKKSAGRDESSELGEE
jgi:membrane protein DedA with SNARE-associated domain